MRDKHDLTNVSTSPPPKKSKFVIEKSSHEYLEKMEIDEKDIVEALPVEEQEPMEVESERSKLMDEKVIAKAKQD